MCHIGVRASFPSGGACRCVAILSLASRMRGYVCYLYCGSLRAGSFIASQPSCYRIRVSPKFNVITSSRNFDDRYRVISISTPQTGYSLR